MFVKKKIVLLLTLLGSIALPLAALAIDTHFARPGYDTITLDGINTLLGTALDWMWTLFSFATIVMFTWIGFLFMTAKGEAGKLADARKMLIWAIVGVIVALLAISMISIVSSLLTGGSSTSGGGPAATGACIDSTTSECTVETEADCTGSGAGYHYAGDNTECPTASGTPGTGACSNSSGQCTVVNEQQCISQGIAFTYQGDGSTCPTGPTTGACCYATVRVGGQYCLITTQTSCSQPAPDGGRFLGPSSTCPAGTDIPTTNPTPISVPCP